MEIWNLANERNRLEKALLNGNLDFSATYMVVNDLHSLVRTYPKRVTSETISALKSVLERSAHTSQTQSLFLYKAAADALSSILICKDEGSAAEDAMLSLSSIVGISSGNQHRAAAEALGSLPLDIHGPAINGKAVKDMPHIRWEKLLKKLNISPSNRIKSLGRSLIAHIDDGNRILVIKLTDTKESSQSLNIEALWMEHLRSNGYLFPMRFEIPWPLKIDGSFLFRLKNLPVCAKISGKAGLKSERFAICFTAHKDYFAYPNDPEKKKQLNRENFREVMFRNAWLLGQLTSLGIVHSAPIPLFHNRMQRNRREDHGIYEWPQGGRLDRWIDSCCYPNFGMTGLRDFEHFFTISEPCRNLYQYIGTHILSLLLVTASYFRNKDSKRLGYDNNGKPVDVRDLFDRPFFNELVPGIYFKYYHGFTGQQFNREMPVDYDDLTSRMIEEMGVDRYMEEILRVAEQREMNDETFRDFLLCNGHTDREIGHLERGVQDITVLTGPHLGGFNHRISLPELITFLETASAFCIAGRYQQESKCGQLRVSV